MPDGWMRWSRRLAPAPLRASAFDPAAADLERDWLTGRVPAPGRLGRALALLSLAVECRRLAAQSRLGRVMVHGFQESWPMSFMTDLRRAIVVLAHQPLFASVAVLT